MHANRRPKSPLRRRSVAGLFCVISGALFLPVACVPTTGVPDDEVLSVPLTVSDFFSPTGYLGDGATVGPLNMIADTCPTQSPNALGDCYVVTYTPPLAATYAGIYWQYPGNNFGAYYGHNIAPGATKVTVWARGENGGEQITFKVGGIATSDSTQPFHDSLQESGPLETLTTTWTQYTVPFNGDTYKEVLGGFAWVMTPPVQANGVPSTKPIVFYLDDIRWSP
jgi:hypothetical protein